MKRLYPRIDEVVNESWLEDSPHPFIKFRIPPKFIMLRPHKLEHPVELIETTAEGTPTSYVVGRICVTISEV